jgi:hypothetical protein
MHEKGFDLIVFGMGDKHCFGFSPCQDCTKGRVAEAPRFRLDTLADHVRAFEHRTRSYMGEDELSPEQFTDFNYELSFRIQLGTTSDPVIDVNRGRSPPS